MHRKRVVPGAVGSSGAAAARQTWLPLVVLVLYIVAALPTVAYAAGSNATAISSTSTESVCEAATCLLTNSNRCDRTVGGCPVCLQFHAATNDYSCTTISATTKQCPTNYVNCTLTPSPTPMPSPSPNAASSSSDGNRAKTMSSSAASDSGVLKPASVTDAPGTEVSTSNSGDSGSGFPTLAIVGIATVVGCVLAAVFGNMYAVRKKRKAEAEEDSSHDGKDPRGGAQGRERESDLTALADSAYNYADTTPSASSTVYQSAAKSTKSADGSVFLKSDSGQHTYQGSASVNMLYIDNPDAPLTTEHLSTSNKEYGSDRDSEEDNVFAMTANSEWMHSGFYEGNHSGNTEFYQSKISAIGDDDADVGFDHRKSEKTDPEHVTRWKQKFYVEL